MNRIMKAGMDAITHLTIKITIDPKFILMSVTITSLILASESVIFHSFLVDLTLSLVFTFHLRNGVNLAKLT